MSITILEEQIKLKVQACEHVKYKGISIGQSMQVAFFSYILAHCSRKTWSAENAGHVVRHLMSLLKRFTIGTFACKLEQQNYYKLASDNKKRIVVICNHSGHVERMTLSLLDRFAKDEVILLTSSEHIFRRLKDKFTACLNVFRPTHFPHLKNIPKFYRYYKEVCNCLKPNGILFKLFLFSTVSSILQAVDYYEDFFNTVEVSAVMTMSDRHWNEYVVTKMAQRYNIPTYTNQHGWFGVSCNYVPIASDKIFVWGEKSREYLISNNVPLEKTVITGNPHFDRVHSWYLPQKDKLRVDFNAKYNLNPDQPIVTYLSTSAVNHICPIETVHNFFECFCWTFNLPVNVIIKLRRQKRSEYAESYRSWIGTLNLHKDVQLLESEDLFECLAVTDIAVTTFSSVGLEAMGFGIPTVAINTVEGVDVKDYAGFTADALECNTPKEFRCIMKRLVTEQAYYRAALEKARKIQETYFYNTKERNCSTLVHDYIFQGID